MKNKSELRHQLANFIELLGSMRFAVSLLMFICIASLIGTVLQQGDMENAYVDRFGPFWFDLFDKFSIWHIYNSWWFLLIMAFLVFSTSVCLITKTPKFLREARTFKEYVRSSSLRAFPNRVQAQTEIKPDSVLLGVQKMLSNMGYKYKVRQDSENEYMVAAKKGSSNRLGFIFAHAAIVVICIGGLLDSELPLRIQKWFSNKTPITENMMVSEVPDSGRLPLNNPSFKAHIMLPEGGRSSNALIDSGAGVLVQPLSFSIKLNEFIVDYYSTGMPSSFKSDVTITDLKTGDSFDRMIEVNEPLHFGGVTVYQSSLDDGGSNIELIGYPLTGSSSNSLTVNAVVNKPTDLVLTNMGANSQETLRLDVTEFKPINVENFDGGEPQPKKLLQHVAEVTGSAASKPNENLVNVGPTVTYKLVDDSGQSTEFINYMLPLTLDGSKILLTGVRNNESESYRYIRFPVDDMGTVQEFMELRAALFDSSMLAQAVDRFVQQSQGQSLDEDILKKAATGAVESFAKGGFNAIIANAPEQDREKILQFAVPMIQVTLANLRDVLREQTNRDPVDPKLDSTQDWNQLAILALANLPEYPAPVFLNLSSFDHKQASVFQVTRSPGKLTVYLGSLFLVIGIFTMFYVRDRRIWVWIQANDKSDGLENTNILAAMTSLKRNLDFNQEFNNFQKTFNKLFTKG